MTCQLFAYGELRRPAVQAAVFGRALTGTPDCVVGYELLEVTVTDQVVIERSGTHTHLSAVLGGAGSRIDGFVYDVTDADLADSDAFRPDEYSRVAVPLESGVTAWTYAFNPTPTSTSADPVLTSPTDPGLDDHRHRLRNAIVNCALGVRNIGWSADSHGHSRHFIAAVALVLDDTDLQNDLNVTRRSILTAWSVTLWGTRRGRQDQTDELILTRAWFERCSASVADSVSPSNTQ
ncbi:gamma-glutamylcyclotransferase family protein [Williamsia serinedens]|uniref:gamma-glutamylcyclotransferase family protein n=1 Tax=Williamsia serinedens TaxID=391736 RepID=UPI0020A35EB6|nr:gamma-glutamylcyclotransferase family protein [Williamsia serinedens]